jgi:hypothetical protein
MGTLFMVNPPKRKKRRTAAQRRATAKMIAANKAKKRGTKKRRRTVKKSTSRKRTTNMAAKRRKRTTTRRRRSSAKRRSPVTSLRRHSVYLTNPRRRRRARPAAAKRRRRRGYSRNPAILSQLKQGVMDAGATLVGGAAARTVSGLLPLPKDGLAGVASGLAVALGIGIAARKFSRGDTARFLTAGAMQVPVKALITTFVPQAGAYLGDYDNVSAYALPAGNSGVGDYLTPGMYGQPDEVEVGVYE